MTIMLVFKDTDFYDWLRTQFTDLESAKLFFRKFKDDDQVTPFGDFSQKAMCYHISMVLEDKQPNNLSATDYINTKYGTDIYWS